MSTEKPNITQIKKYLNGELDARAMHEMERQALHDPFLADALAGYQQAGKEQQPNLNDLQARLQQRAAPQRKTIALWPQIAIAASVLVFLSIGAWWLLNYRPAANKPAGYSEARVPVQPQLLPKGSAPSTPDTGLLKPQAAPNAALAKQVTPGNSLTSVNPPVDSRLPKVVADEVMAQSKNAIAPSAMEAPPAAASKLSIRGQRSIAVDSPLYVLDGKVIKGKVPNIDTKDIADVLVLNGARATAIYGAAATNGAIIITTKMGMPTKPLADSNLLASNNLNKVAVEKNAQKNISVTRAMQAAQRTAAAPVTETLSGRVAGIAIEAAGGNRAPYLVKGKVTGADDDLPLPGVTVSAGGNQTTTTDVNGNFKIPVSGAAELQFGYIGYEKKTVKVNKTDSLKIALQSSHAALAEVVVTKPTNIIKQAHPKYGWENYKAYLANQSANAAEDGTVQLSFTVNTDGTLNNFSILKGFSPQANQHAIQIIKNGPEWAPNLNGKPETVKLKITFKK